MKNTIVVHLQYFALLREQAGKSTETLTTTASTVEALYAEISHIYGFTFSPDHLKVAINDDFAEWSSPLRTNDTVIFIPPVAGG